MSARDRKAYMRRYHFKRKEAMRLYHASNGTTQRTYAPRNWNEDELTEPWSVYHARKQQERAAARAALAAGRVEPPLSSDGDLDN